MAVSAFTTGVDGPILGADEAAFLKDSQPWGVILFARNVESPDQLRRLTGGIRDALGRDAPVLVDQEGGRVQRLGPPHWRQWPAPLDHAAATEGSERAMFLRGALIGAELHAVGIDVNCAPTCDIAFPETHPFLRNRCLGSDAATVTRRARAMAEGLMASGILPVIKHIPGHGRGQVDSHLSLPVTDAAVEDLRAVDFAPFRALADLPMAMTAHMVFCAFGDGPVTTDAAMIRDVIRSEIGFDGLLMSDDIAMQALGGTVPDRARAAQAAGCDLVLHCNGTLAERIAVAAAVAPMNAAAQARAAAALARRTIPDPIDIAAAEAELEALTQGRIHG